MSNRPEIRPSDNRQGEYVATANGATFHVRRVVGAMEQWIATSANDPSARPVTGFLLQDVEAKLASLAVR